LNCPASWVKVGFSDAAANTTTDLAAGGLGDEDCEADGDFEPQAVRFVTRISERKLAVIQFGRMREP
jgi:hypothetical protein